MSGASFQAAVDRTLGMFGRSFGRPHAAYRITPTSSGDFPTGWTKLTAAWPTLRNRVSGRHLEQTLMSDRTLWYELDADLSPFRLGDTFVATDKPYVAGQSYGAGATSVIGASEFDGFTFAGHIPAQPPFGARVHLRVGIYRPTLVPLMQSDSSFRWDGTHEAALPLILQDGVFSLGGAGDAASFVPCGLGSNDRHTRGQAFPPDNIAIPPTPMYFAYLPPLPGYVPKEGDVLIDENDARYTIVAAYAQQSGAVGSQVLTERFIGSGVTVSDYELLTEGGQSLLTESMLPLLTERFAIDVTALMTEGKQELLTENLVPLSI